MFSGQRQDQAMAVGEAQFPSSAKVMDSYGLTWGLDNCDASGCAGQRFLPLA